MLRLTSPPALLRGRGIPREAVGPWLRLTARHIGESRERGAAESVPREPFVLAGLAGDHPLLSDLRRRVKLQIPAAGLGEEGFAIEIPPQHVIIAADAPAGVFYGCQSLLDIADTQDGTIELPCRVIADWPLLKRRGFHLMAVSRLGMPAIESLLTEILPRRRVNAVVVEINYNYEFRSHPEVREDNCFTREDCRRMVELARANFITIIPQMNCLGHQSWQGVPLGLLRAYPELDETAGLPEIFERPRPHCWCPSNPKVMPVVRDLIGELIDAFDAKEFHCGMDEAFYIGKCAKCSKSTPDRLFAKSVRELHAYVTGRRGVQMLVWGDRLLDAKAFGYSEWEGSITGTHPAAEKIPKDIIICDWHYGERKEFPSIPYLQSLGFRVWPTGWNTRANAENLATYALLHHTHRLEGYMASSWTSLIPLRGGFEGDAESLKVKNIAGVVEATDAGLSIAWRGRR